MPECRNCGKKGLFLKIEGKTGLCLSCNGTFAQEARLLTEKIMKAKSEAATAKDADRILASCNTVERFGGVLISLHKVYNLQPSQALLDLIETHKNIRESMENQSGS